MEIRSRNMDIRGLFDSGNFVIPRFQRPYSWDKENINEFWNDIVDERSENYFIGSMVFYNKKGRIYGVVDGQQRLTTITMILCSIRNRFNNIQEKNLSVGIQNLIERDNIENQKEFVLKTETSYPFFQRGILQFNATYDRDNLSKEEEGLWQSFDHINKKRGCTR